MPALGDQLGAHGLQAPAADAAGLDWPRLAPRAVGPRPEQRATPDTAALHSQPSRRAGSGRFSALSTHRERDDRVIRRAVVGLVDPPAAPAVAGDRARGVLGQLVVCGHEQATFDHRGVQPGAGRDHAGVRLRERDARDALALQLGGELAGAPRVKREKDRALWATALYAGMRRGELEALHREDVDLATGVIADLAH